MSVAKKLARLTLFLASAAWVALLVEACDFSATANSFGADASADGRGGREDSSFPTGTDANACQPADVSTFNEPYHAARSPAPKCSESQIAAYYNDCIAPGHTAAACAVWTDKGNVEGRACAGCIRSTGEDVKFGPVVDRQGRLSANVAGCLELLGDATGLQCAKSVQAAEACAAYACAINCSQQSLAAFEGCAQYASGGGCKTLAEKAQCVSEFVDAGATDVCFGDGSFEQQYKAIVPLFCLGPSDAGGGG